MSGSDMLRQKITRLSKELASLQRDKSHKVAKCAGANQKANAASAAASRSRSDSTIQSKYREMERYSKQAADIQNDVARIENNIARKQTDLQQAQSSLSREEERERRNRERREKETEYQRTRQMRDLGQTLSQHALEIKTLKELPEKIVVLFLAAQPVEQNALRLDEEVRSISDMIRKSKHRDSVKLESCWAVRPLDVLQATNEYDPSIIHFSGHGSESDEIIFLDESGHSKPVTKEALVQTIAASSSKIRLVFLNTCFSGNQAEAIAEHVEAAIGMDSAINDDAARIFASQFYSTIGFGLSVAQAFEQAKALLMLEGIHSEHVPQLFVKSGLNAADIIIVKPPSDDTRRGV